jgi:hypothetical protein
MGSPDPRDGEGENGGDDVVLFKGGVKYTESPT